MEHPLYDVDLAVILCEMNAFKDGLLFLYEKMKLYKEVIACYMQAHDHEGLIQCCKKIGDSSQGRDPSLFGDLLKYFGELGEDCSEEVKEVLTYIERDDVLPPIVVLQMLSKNPCLTLSVVKDYIARKLEQESKLIEDDRRSIEKYQVGILRAFFFSEIIFAFMFFVFFFLISLFSFLLFNSFDHICRIINLDCLISTFSSWIST